MNLMSRRCGKATIMDLDPGRSSQGTSRMLRLLVAFKMRTGVGGMLRRPCIVSFSIPLVSYYKLQLYFYLLTKYD